MLPLPEYADLVLAFGSRFLIGAPQRYEELRARYPGAQIVLSSTSGQIQDTEVTDECIVATAVCFEHTSIRADVLSILPDMDSAMAGQLLAHGLNRPALSHVFVVSDGQHVNGTALADGFNSHLPDGVLLTGGMAGDGPRFEQTLVGLNGPAEEGLIVALGFYGDRLRIGFGSEGGWSPFGPMRRVTRSENNILYELNGQSALGLYKRYLGPQADLLPSAALRFPLSLTTADGQHTLVRTILSIDEATESMTFAGDVPEGTFVRFMRASYEELVDGAEAAAENSLSSDLADADLAICVSCVGRKIVMGQRTEDETEAVREVLGDTPTLTGFYSYGELAPRDAMAHCELHNQTMTITLLKEV
ncbi:MAG: FIST N-terminal domain-containing protein [Rhodothermales bacterium]